MLVTGRDFTPSNEVDYGTCSYVSKNHYDQDENIQLKNGDVLITKDGTLGKVAIVGNLPKPATLNGGVLLSEAKTANFTTVILLIICNHLILNGL